MNHLRKLTYALLVESGGGSSDMARHRLSEQSHADDGTVVLDQLTIWLDRSSSHPSVGAVLLVRASCVPYGQITELGMLGHLPAAIVPVERPAPADDLVQLIEILLVPHLEHDYFHDHSLRSQMRYAASIRGSLGATVTLPAQRRLSQKSYTQIVRIWTSHGNSARSPVGRARRRFKSCRKLSLNGRFLALPPMRTGTFLSSSGSIEAERADHATDLVIAPSAVVFQRAGPETTARSMPPARLSAGGPIDPTARCTGGIHRQPRAR